MSNVRALHHVVAATLLAAITPVVALHAQSVPSLPGGERAISVGIAGGVSVPRHGASASSLRAGLHSQGFVLVRLPAGLPALRFNVDYTRQTLTTSRSVDGMRAAGGEAESVQTLLAGVLGAKIDLLRGPVRPYIVAGVGGFSVAQSLAADAAGAAARGSAQASATSDRSLAFGLDGGAGISVRVGALRAFAETRLQNVYTRDRGLVDLGSVQSFPVTFGLSF